jgi:hypothetical protein
MENITHALDPATLALVERLEHRQKYYYSSNRTAYNYYYAKLKVQDLGISTPPSLLGLNNTLGWASSAVDVVAERLTFEGCYSASNEELANRLNTIYRDNEIAAIQRSVLKSALITGTSYISVAPGNVELGEPRVLIRSESPNSMVGDFNERTLRLDNALKVIKQGDNLIGTLWLPNETINLIKPAGGSQQWRELGERNVHNLGRVTIVCVRNNYDDEYPTGRTEITRPLRTLIMSACRTLTATETAREFFAMPLRAISGADPEDFLNEDGTAINSWNMIASRILGIPYNTKDGIAPSITQLPASDPQSIMNLVNKYAVLAAREVGVSAAMFSFDTVNAASAEAINEADKKLIKKAEERQHEVARAWKQALSFAVLIEDGAIPEDWNDIETIFRPVETISRAQEADAMQKLNSMGLYEKPFPDYVYRKLGLKPVEIAELKAWFKIQQGNKLIESLLTNNGAEPTTTQTTGE